MSSPATSSADPEPRWPASLALLGAIVLYLTLPSRLVHEPRWLLPLLECALLIPLSLRAPNRSPDETRAARIGSIMLVAVVNVANLVSLGELVHLLLHPPASGSTGGRELVLAAVQIWLTNVVIFGLWYWELDRGGPGSRAHPVQDLPDFLFPQMATPQIARAGWRPVFLDYLYVSFTNATAFSPTDTMPLTPAAKVLMAVQSLASLITVALVAARAVNILS
jgi:uncharacterized membrane protein